MEPSLATRAVGLSTALVGTVMAFVFLLDLAPWWVFVVGVVLVLFGVVLPVVAHRGSSVR